MRAFRRRRWPRTIRSFGSGTHMVIRFNADIVGDIVRASLRDASPEEMRDLYIRRNVFEIDPDAPVYRIVELQYFHEDLTDKRLTHTKIDKDNWGDKSENPLLGREFRLAETEEPLTLDGVVGNAYASCWSATELDARERWAIFSRNQPSVRLQSTPRKLLNAVMSRDNQFYMQQHAIGRMQYAADGEIEAHFADPNWQKHLDSLGQGIAASFLRLSENLSYEDEVRLIYDHSRDTWPAAHVRRVDKFAKVPFDWPAVIDAVLVGPLVADGGEALVRGQLLDFGINCPVSSSEHRTGVG